MQLVVTLPLASTKMDLATGTGLLVVSLNSDFGRPGFVVVVVVGPDHSCHGGVTHSPGPGVSDYSTQLNSTQLNAKNGRRRNAPLYPYL